MVAGQSSQRRRGQALLLLERDRPRAARHRRRHGTTPSTPAASPPRVNPGQPQFQRREREQPGPHPSISNDGKRLVFTSDARPISAAPTPTTASICETWSPTRPVWFPPATSTRSSGASAPTAVAAWPRLARPGIWTHHRRNFARTPPKGKITMASSPAGGKRMVPCPARGSTTQPLTVRVTQPERALRGTYRLHEPSALVTGKVSPRPPAGI